MPIYERQDRRFFPGAITRVVDPTGLSSAETIEELAEVLQGGAVIEGSSANILGNELITNCTIEQLEEAFNCPTVVCNDAQTPTKTVQGTGFGSAQTGSAKLETYYIGAWGEREVASWSDTSITAVDFLQGDTFRVTNHCGNSDTAQLLPIP